MLSKSLAGEEIVRELINVLSVPYSIRSNHTLANMRDQASINNVAICTMKIVYPLLVDVGCLSHTIDHMAGLQDSLLSVVGNHTCVVLCGDFNVSNIDWAISPNASLLCEIVSDSFMTQIVNVPTRGKNTLDLVLTMHPDIVRFMKMVDNLLDCDHDSVLFQIEMMGASSRSSHPKKLYNLKLLILMNSMRS